MKMIPLRGTEPRENKALLKEHLQGRTVRECGVAGMPPGQVAHEGEHHVHDDDEVFFVLSGEVSVPIDGEVRGIARTGDWFVVEAGEEHHVTNHTSEPAVVIYMHPVA